jgi:hypothetical protein
LVVAENMFVIVKVRKNTWPGQRFTLLVIIVLEKAGESLLELSVRLSGLASEPGLDSVV